MDWLEQDYGLRSLAVFELTSDRRRQLEASTDPIDRWLAGRLILYQQGVFPMALGDELSALGALVQARDFLAQQQIMVEGAPNTLWKLNWPQNASQWGQEFLRQFSGEIKQAICSDSKRYEDTRKDSTAFMKSACVALSAVVMKRLGVSEPTALGIATLCLLTILHVTKNALCKMTDEEVVERLRRESSGDKSRGSGH